MKRLIILLVRLYVWKRFPDVKERYHIERDTATYLGERYPDRWHTLSKRIHDNPKDPREKTDNHVYSFLSTHVYHYDPYSEHRMRTKNHYIHEKAQDKYRERIKNLPEFMK